AAERRGEAAKCGSRAEQEPREARPQVARQALRQPQASLSLCAARRARRSAGSRARVGSGGTAAGA
ncbi:MAG: hypothetical protein SGPRY_007250, partial [Prymnesium sp.]